MKKAVNPSMMMGIGIGLMISSLVWAGYQNSLYSAYQIEKRARQLGMKYPSEIRVLENNELGGDSK
ncbi:MAG: flagellar protein [Clostridia bacterium]|nr:flagellar protein [Clostridia bacterium]